MTFSSKMFGGALVMVSGVDVVDAVLSTWVAEASTLGIRPGEVHTELLTTLGNRKPFLLEKVTTHGFFYRQKDGVATLVVVND
jgi:hypothetical protein